MKALKLLFYLSVVAISSYAQGSFKFDFTGGKAKEGYIKIKPDCYYSDETGYGYDLQPTLTGNNHPFFFSVRVPDGNYKVTVKLGSKEEAGVTTVRGESRRLFIENLPTHKGEIRKQTFVINKRDRRIAEGEYVKIKPREKKKLNWDDRLTLEFNGDAPRLSELIIEKASDNVTTVFLCGNSTVVDQDNEPWGSWGQMIPRFFDERVCIANYAESGESANTFLAAKRLKKALTQMKTGDYVFAEFGHNDEKQKGVGKGPYLSYTSSLREFIKAARNKGAIIVFVTPTQRRSFGENGKLEDTHGEFPVAMRKLAKEENVPVIDLTEMTKELFETWGPDLSVKAFVHYPANTYPGQTQALEDDTHFNPFGAYQIAKCVLQGIKENKLGIAKYIKKDFRGYDPARPDPFDSFHWNLSPFTEIEKPDGN